MTSPGIIRSDYLPIPRVHLKKSANDLSNDAYAKFIFSFFSSFFIYFIFFFIKFISCRYPFELHRQVDPIQMGTNNICLYKEVDKKYTSHNLEDCGIA